MFYPKLIIVLILDVVSALSARYAFDNESTLFLVIAMASIALAGYFFIQLLTERITIVVNAIWIALGAINVTVASWLVYGEQITWVQGLGMALLVTGIIMVEAFAPAEEEEQINTAVI